MKRWPVLSTFAVGVALLIITSLAWPQQPDKVGNVMRVKLDHAQQVLEGLTSEDYPLIAKNAQQLTLLSLATNWEVLQTPEYLDQSKEFQRAADALTKAAQSKNIDAATLAYVNLTVKCVACHKYVRDVKANRGDPSPNGLPKSDRPKSR